MLFKDVRKKFKARTAIRLYNQSDCEIVKSDRKMRDAGIANGMNLHVSIHPSNPEVFAIFVTLLTGARITLSMTEVIRCIVM